VLTEVGADKLAVLLLSVDPEYFDKKKEEYEPQAWKLFKKLGITWPNVWVAGGWAEMNRTFNADGYGLTLVDAQGLVRGVDLRGDEFARLAREVTGARPAK
jgi:hypothetical protein